MVNLCPPCIITQPLIEPQEKEKNLCECPKEIYFPNVEVIEKEPELTIDTCLNNLITNMGMNKYCNINPKCCGS